METTINLQDLQGLTTNQVSAETKTETKIKDTPKPVVKTNSSRRRDPRVPPPDHNKTCYCWICGKTFRDKWILTRHESTNKHQREEEEYRRLAALAPEKDPNSKEYWEHHNTVDWKKTPTPASKVWEDLLEKGEDTTWYTYIQQNENPIPQPQKMEIQNEDGKDPRLHHPKYKDAFDHQAELEEILSNPIDEKTMEAEIQRLADMFLTDEEKKIVETVKVKDNTENTNNRTDDLEEGEIIDEPEVPEPIITEVVPVTETRIPKTKFQLKSKKKNHYYTAVVKRLKKTSKLKRKPTATPVKKPTPIEFYPWDNLTFDKNFKSNTQRRLEREAEKEYQDYKRFEDMVMEKIFKEDGGWVALSSVGRTDEILEFQLQN